MNSQFLNSEADLKWLLETHLKPANRNNDLPFPVKSFVLQGNEDCPTGLTLYPVTSPTVTDTRYAYAFLCDNGKYSCTGVRGGNPQ